VTISKGLGRDLTWVLCRRSKPWYTPPRPASFHLFLSIPLSPSPSLSYFPSLHISLSNPDGNLYTDCRVGNQYQALTHRHTLTHTHTHTTIQWAASQRPGDQVNRPSRSDLGDQII